MTLTPLSNLSGRHNHHYHHHQARLNPFTTDINQHFPYPTFLSSLHVLSRIALVLESPHSCLQGPLQALGCFYRTAGWLAGQAAFRRDMYPSPPISRLMARLALEES